MKYGSVCHQRNTRPFLKEELVTAKLKTIDIRFSFWFWCKICFKLHVWEVFNLFYTWGTYDWTDPEVPDPNWNNKDHTCRSRRKINRFWGRSPPHEAWRTTQGRTLPIPSQGLTLYVGQWGLSFNSLNLCISLFCIETPDRWRYFYNVIMHKKTCCFPGSWRNYSPNRPRTDPYWSKHFGSYLNKAVITLGPDHGWFFWQQVLLWFVDCGDPPAINHDPL